MGRAGFGVEFGDAESPAPLTPYGEMLERLGDFVDDISVAEAKVAMAQAARARRIEEARAWAVYAASQFPGDDSHHARTELAERSFVAQLAGALHMSEAAARNVMWSSRCLVNDLPDTLAALAAGAISFRHARILVDQVSILDPESVAMLEQKVLPRGKQQTPPQFEKSVRLMSEKLNLESMVERHVEAVEERNTYLEPMPNGMGRYSIEAPMVLLVAIDDRATEMAKSVQSEGDLRTLAQRKTDVLTDLLLDVDGHSLDGQANTIAGQGDGPIARFRSIRPKVLVTVPAMTLLRRGQEPGVLEGYGPIDPQTARELAGNAKSFVRLLSHPETGIALSMGRKRYRIPAQLRMWLRVRDGRCRFPGCNRNVARCELDHTREWASESGETAHNNLAHLCPGHHALKGNADWKVEQNLNGSGELTWTSPTGHVFCTEPELRVQPAF
ncbi:MAG TPA: DUF222 domain-containing protein [Galbitalea sp.]|jgi:hypothetical protein|nr:DUF222 domain-containing protein [Galbitalea sp.]